MYRFVVVAGFLAAAFGLGRPASAQESAIPGRTPAAAGDTLLLSLSEAQRLALQQNPAFLADAQEAEIARGALGQARVYNYNPEVEVEAPGAASSPGAGAYEVRLGQEVEWAGQRGLRVQAARIGLDRAERVVQNAARMTLADASQAYYAALAAERRLSLATAILDLAEQLLAATRIQVKEGEISVLEANLAEIEYGRARARVLTARREATSAALELRRLTGLAPAHPIRLVDEVPTAPDPTSLDPDRLIALAVARRPDLAAGTAAVQELETLQRLARREAIPNLTVGALAEREGDGGDPRIGIGVSLPVPVWNRNQGVVAQREAQAEQAALQRRAIELRIRTQVVDALRAYAAASEEAQVFEADVLRPARENQRLLGTAYRAGKIGLAELLLLRNQLMDAEQGYWDAWLAKRHALVELQAATATLGEPQDLNTSGNR